ncbi:MAG: ABC transporter permease [Candidatus Promineifilaceae bacterium]
MQSILNLRYKLADFSEVVALISFIFVFLIFVFQAENFLTLLSITNILSFASIKGIFVIGVAMLMISGEFDLSVGSTLAVSAYVFGILMEFGVVWMNPPFAANPIIVVPAGIPMLALLISLIIAAILGYINGWIVVNTGIPSFIATLGTMLAFRGIARALGQLELTKLVVDGNGQQSLQSFESEADVIRFTGETPPLFNWLNGDILFINDMSVPAGGARLAIFWFVLFLIIAVIVMRYTRYGSWVYATGGNRAAALAQGVNINRVLITNFVITGVLAGFAGIAQFGSRPAIDPARGEGWELIAVAACVIGGIWLQGGYGTIIGAAIGMLLLQMVEQGLILGGVDIQLFQATIGLILILAVISNTYLSKQ